MSTISIPRLLEDMVGTWSVSQRMWPAYGADAQSLPRATARRRLVGGAFVEEIMTPEEHEKGDAFERIAFLNFNAVDQRYEYFSLDTRAPQMMNERSLVSAASPNAQERGALELFGGSFVAPSWGDAVDASFTYRLTVGLISSNRQVVSLYLTPRKSGAPLEFCAFEYAYTRTT